MTLEQTPETEAASTPAPPHAGLRRIRRALWISVAVAVALAALVGVLATPPPAATLAAEGGEWPMLTDPDGRIAVSLGVAGIPQSFLISPDGLVVSKILGGVRAEDLEKLVQQAEAQRR